MQKSYEILDNILESCRSSVETSPRLEKLPVVRQLVNAHNESAGEALAPEPETPKTEYVKNDYGNTSEVVWHRVNSINHKLPTGSPEPSQPKEYCACNPKKDAKCFYHHPEVFFGGKRFPTEAPEPESTCRGGVCTTVRVANAFGNVMINPPGEVRREYCEKHQPEAPNAAPSERSMRLDHLSPADKKYVKDNYGISAKPTYEELEEKVDSLKARMREARELLHHVVYYYGNTNKTEIKYDNLQKALNLLSDDNDGENK